MTIDTAIRMDSEDTPTPYLSIQASDGTSRYALQQYLIDFKRIRILEQDYELTGMGLVDPHDHSAYLALSPHIVKRLEQENAKLRTRTDELWATINGLKVERDDQAEVIKKLVEERDDLKERLQAYLGRYAELDREYGKAATERDALRARVKDRESRIDELLATNMELKQERDQANDQFCHVLGGCNQLTALQRKLNDARDNVV